MGNVGFGPISGRNLVLVAVSFMGARPNPQLLREVPTVNFIDTYTHGRNDDLSLGKCKSQAATREIALALLPLVQSRCGSAGITYLGSLIPIKSSR